jgi:Protein of unknown function (DUF3224)
MRPLALLVPALLALAPAAAIPQDDVTAPTARTMETEMTHHASGRFEVQIDPRTPAEGEPAAIGRLVLDKRYSGDLEATGQGQMLAYGRPEEGSAGYVAMEVVSGTLGGRSGTFALQHSGTMDQGELSLTLTVVPGSGTDELVGLAGSMAIVIEGGTHSYELDYTLP